MKNILIFVLILFIPHNVFADKLSNILLRSDNYHVLSKADIDYFMSLQRRVVVGKIKKIHQNMECKKKKSIPSQFAILYLSLYSNTNESELINDVWNCDKKLSVELPPCEYYCAYKFAINLQNIRQKKVAFKKPHVGNYGYYHNGISHNLSVDSTQNILSKYSEDELLTFLFNDGLRPTLPEDIVGNLKNVQISNLFTSGIYYALLNAKSIETRNIIFKELLYFYSRDASGDGGVSSLENIIFAIESKNIK